MRLYLIRHGETDLNKQKILQGRSDYALNDYGRRLARLTGQKLKNVKFDVAYTSPLSRAKETAEILLRENQVSNPVLVEEERIQEISFGDFEGKCYGRENFNIPDETFLNFFENPSEYHTPPGGESLEDVMVRTGAFWQELLRDEGNKEKTVLLSTHGCALKAILANIRQTPVAEFWGEGVHKNCAVSIVDVINGSAVVTEDGKLFYEEEEI